MFNSFFPLSLPTPTAFYLILYLATLVIHVIFMNYVLAGAGYVAIASLFTGGPARQRQKAASTAMLRDWLPFGISAAITAGVAPLLFLQILYREEFYTANLLLFNRWMLIVPVLIAGFYLSYLLKSRRIGAWPAAARLAVGGGVFASILFTAYSWTENHLLSTDRASWADFYSSSAIIYRNAEAPARAAMWIVGAVPTMVTILAWQLWHLANSPARHGAVDGENRGIDGASMKGAGPAAPTAAEVRWLAGLAAVSLVIAGVFAAVYALLLEPAAREALRSPAARPWIAAAGVGAVLQLTAWHRTFHGRAVIRLNLGLASAGVLLTITGMTVARELVRLSRMDLESLYPRHAAALEKGGLVVFLAFFAVNAILIAWCFRLARRPAPEHAGNVPHQQ